MQKIARGIRNNNPGNIRHNPSGKCNWIGCNCNDVKLDKNFCTFDTMENGCRALLKNLITYNLKYNIDTINDIINRWAPSNENDTKSYVNFVASYLNVEPNVKLNLCNNKQLILEIAKAIALFENGNDASLISETCWSNAFKRV